MIRTLDSHVTIPGTGYRSFGSNPLAPVAAGVVNQIDSTRDTEITPNWARYKKLRRSSRLLPLPIHSFKFVRTRLFYSPLIWQETYDFSSSLSPVNQVGYWSSSIPEIRPDASLVPTVGELLSLRARTDAKILEKLKDQSANLALVYAERGRTAQLVGDTATRIAKSFAALKKGNLSAAAAALGVKSLPQRMRKAFSREYRRNPERAYSKAWLELQYGWRPLLQDVYGSAEFLAKSQNREISSVVRSKVSVRLSDSFKTNDGFNRFEIVQDRETLVDVNQGCRFTTSGVALATAKEAGLVNPASLAWELIPFSFVVDWFIPVGNYINNLDATLGLRFDSGYVTYFWRGSTRRICMATNRRATGGGFFTPNSTFTVLSRGNIEDIFCERQATPSFPENPIPRFKNPLSFEHALNAIALLRQTFKR